MSFKKNTAVTGFTVGLVSSTDGSDITTGTPVGYRTLDGGTQTAIGDVTPTHEGNGQWSFDLTAAEMNGDIVGLTFTHASAISAHFTIKTETTLVSDLNDVAATDIVSAGAITTLSGAVANVDLVDTTTTNTDMRGTDSAATAANLATVDANVDAILVDTAEIGTAGAGLTDLGGMSTGMKAEVESECNDALVGQDLDHLFNAAITGTDVTDDSFAAKLVSASATADFDDFDNTTDALPALATSIGNIAVGSSAVSVQAESFTSTTSTVASGSVVNTETTDGVYHQLQDIAGVLDVYYEFNVTGSGVASEVTVVGRVNGGNDDLDGVYAWDWVGATWDRVGDYVGQNGTTDNTLLFSLLVRHTGTGANLGKVRFRFYAATGLTSANLYVDQIFTSYAIVSQSVGYADGAIWLDTVNGTAGTEAYVNGTADNPVLTLADALTLATSVGLSRFFVISGSNVTFTSSQDGNTWLGSDWTLALGGQSLTDTGIHGATVTGVGIGSDPEFMNCIMGDVSIPSAHLHNCGQSGVTTGITLTTNAGAYLFDQCYSTVQAPGSPLLTFGTGAQKVSFRHHSGGIQFEGMIAGQFATIEGRGQFKEGTCTGGTVTLRGIKTTSGVTNVTINEDSTLGYSDGAVWIDTTAGEAGTANGVATIGRPSSNVADMRTIADSLNIRQTKNLAGTVMTLDQSFQNWNFLGILGVVDFNGQDTSGSTYLKTAVTGTCTGAIRQIVDNSGVLGPCNMPPSNFLRTGFTDGTFTCGGTGVYLIYDCVGSDALGAASVIDVDGDGVTATTVNFVGWNGNLELQGMTSVDAVTITGNGQITLDSSCVGGTIVISGNFKFTDNSSGMTISYDDNTTNVGSIKEIADLGLRGAAVTGTLSTTEMTTDLTEATTSHYVGRLLTFTTGTLTGQQKEITSYDGTTKKLGFSALTDAPIAGDDFILS